MRNKQRCRIHVVQAKKPKAAKPAATAPAEGAAPAAEKPKVCFPPATFSLLFCAELMSTFLI